MSKEPKPAWHFCLLALNKMLFMGPESSFLGQGTLLVFTEFVVH
jgi:hypothetical protein